MRIVQIRAVRQEHDRTLLEYFDRTYLQIRTRLHPPPVSETRAAAAHSFAQHSARHTALHENDLFMAVYCSYTVRILGQQFCFVVPSPTGICLAGPRKDAPCSVRGRKEGLHARTSRGLLCRSIDESIDCRFERL